MGHSIFAIIGPVMVGPSSSHTAGAVRLGNVARALFGEVPDEVDIVLYGSFGEVYDGHMTDRALVAGVVGLSPNDTKIQSSFEIARDEGVKIKLVPKPKAGKRYHPNTAKFYFRSGKRKMMVLGSSVGAGRIEIVQIDDMPVAIDGEHDIAIFTSKNGTKVLKLITEATKGTDAQLLQIFSKLKRRNSSQTRYVVEMKGLPEKMAHVFEKSSDISRVSLIPHINLWENVCLIPIPKKMSQKKSVSKKK